MSSTLHGKQVSWNELRRHRAWTGSGTTNAAHDNTGLSTKLSIRRTLARALGSPIHVLDAFCGEGRIYHEVYEKVELYKGLDREKIHTKSKCELVKDNRAWLQNNSIADYNLFDLDAHSSPWELMYMIIRNKTFGTKHKRVAFATTDGTLMLLKLSGCSTFQKAILRIPRNMKIPCLQRHYEFFVMLLLTKAADQIGWKIVYPIYKGFNKRANVQYAGFVLSAT